MKRSVPAVPPALAATVLLLGLGFGTAACSEQARDAAGDRAAENIGEGVDRAVGETYRVTYEVLGDGVESVEFNAGRGTATEPHLDTTGHPATPWRRTVTLRGIAAPTVLAVPGPGATEVTCRIRYGNEVIEEQTSDKPLVPASCVALSPVAG